MVSSFLLQECSWTMLWVWLGRSWRGRQTTSGSLSVGRGSGMVSVSVPSLLILLLAMPPCRELLRGEDEFGVPRVFPELTTRRVLTCELVRGVPLDECVSLPQETRNNVSQHGTRTRLLVHPSLPFLPPSLSPSLPPYLPTSSLSLPPSLSACLKAPMALLEGAV